MRSRERKWANKPASQTDKSVPAQTGTTIRQTEGQNATQLSPLTNYHTWSQEEEKEKNSTQPDRTRLFGEYTSKPVDLQSSNVVVVDLLNLSQVPKERSGAEANFVVAYWSMAHPLSAHRVRENCVLPACLLACVVSLLLFASQSSLWGDTLFFTTTSNSQRLSVHHSRPTETGPACRGDTLPPTGRYGVLPYITYYYPQSLIHIWVIQVSGWIIPSPEINNVYLAFLICFS